jgi:hypothetical protein
MEGLHLLEEYSMAAAKTKTLADAFASIDALVERVEVLESMPRRTGRPPVITACHLGKKEGECDKASVYQYHQGCRGQQCSTKMSQYTAKVALRRAEKATPIKVAGNGAKKAPAKVSAIKKAAPKAVAPPARKVVKKAS